MKRYTVKQLATLSGVSVRTLHHYDEIGLLEPAYVGDNGYRYYEEDELLRLQQILFHRELGLPLAEIRAILDRPDFDRLEALEEHKTRIEAKAKRYRRLLRTIDRTIAELKGRAGTDRGRGDYAMKHADLYKGFTPEKQTEYERWLVERYGGDMRERIDGSKARFAQLEDAQKNKLMTDLADIEADLAESCRRGIPADSPALEQPLARHREWVAYMWDRPCSPEAYAELADLYLSHADFRTRYDTLAPGFCEYLAAAMKAYAQRIGAAGGPLRPGT